MDIIKQIKLYFKTDFRVTSTIIYVCILFYVLSALPALLSGNIYDADSLSLIRLGANVQELVESGEYFRLLTAILHGGIIHLFFNMYALYSIGNFIETYFGRSKYFAVFIITGIVGSLTSYLFTRGFSVGASGAVFGLLGLLLAQKLKRKVYYAELPIDTRSILIIVGINLLLGFTIPNVDNAAHIGGLISGTLLGLLLNHENAPIQKPLLTKVLLIISSVLVIYSLFSLVLTLF